MKDALEDLLGRARHVVPTAGTKGRLRSRVLQAAASGAMSSAAGVAAASAAGAAVKSSWILLAYVSGGVALGLLVAGPLLMPGSTAPDSRPPGALPTASSRSALVAPSSEAFVASPASAPVSRAITGPSPRASSEPTLPSLERETALLAEAQGALQRGDARRALRWLDQYDREFSQGNLVEEASAVRAVCTCALSPGSKATTLAAFRSRFPGSPLLPRVSRACASGKGSHDDFELEPGKPATQFGEPEKDLGHEGEFR